MHWTPTRAAALSRLEAFVPKMGEAYARTRNYDLGPSDRSNVSALSPWLSARVLAEEEVLEAALARHGPGAAQAFIREVFWRGYFKGWLEHQPDVWARYLAGVADGIGALGRDAGLAARYEAACAGHTGIGCLDAWARELCATGYLHNHARMWFASIWIFTLKLPWELGADFFLRHLLDADAASNTCSWRWVAGLHTRGKTYLARAGNIATYTEGRFAETPGLSPDALALSEPALAPKRPPALAAAALEGRRFALLICEGDGLPETLALPGPPAAILVLSAPAARSPLPGGALAREFAIAATGDAGRRAGRAFGLDCTGLPETGWMEAITDFAQTDRFDTVATARLATGPNQTRIRQAFERQPGQRIRLSEITRPYDAAVWPHTHAGFFKLKEAIPRLLSRLGRPLV